MPRRPLLALALFLLLGLSWYGFSPTPTASRPATSPAAIPSSDNTAQAVSELRKTSPANVADTPIMAAKTLPYCALEDAPTTSMASLADAFQQRHRELGATQADVELIFGVTAEIGMAAAEDMHEVDTQTKRITATGRFHNQQVETLAELATTDPEAAMIYGTHLMYQGMMTDNGTGISLDKLAEGERILQYALQHGQQRAGHRLYIYHYFASMRAWRKHGRTPAWHTVETARAAYSQWLLRNSTAGVALLIDNDYRTGTRENHRGEHMPTGDLHDPTAVAQKLASLEHRLPATTLTQEQIQQREHLLWLNRRGLVDAVFAAQRKDCEPE